MCIKYDLIPDRDFIHFDNASLPGMFIIAVGDLARIKKVNHNWRASSLYNDKKQLPDQYGLLRKNKKRWMMTPTNNGDVSSVNNILDLASRLGNNTVDFYTSDLGFDASGDYNAQEAMHSKAHYGQALLGLLLVKPGGNMLLKQYTIMVSSNIYLIQILSRAFEKVIIYKPLSSPSTNSECYLICKNYKNNISEDEFCGLLTSLDEFDTHEFNPENEYFEKVNSAMNNLIGSQISSLQFPVYFDSRAKDLFIIFDSAVKSI